MKVVEAFTRSVCISQKARITPNSTEPRSALIPFDPAGSLEPHRFIVAPKENSRRALGAWRATLAAGQPVEEMPDLFQPVTGLPHSAPIKSRTAHLSLSVVYMRTNKILEFHFGGCLILPPHPEVSPFRITRLRIQLTLNIPVFGRYLHYHKNICVLSAFRIRDENGKTGKNLI